MEYVFNGRRKKGRTNKRKKKKRKKEGKKKRERNKEIKKERDINGRTGSKVVYIRSLLPCSAWLVKEEEEEDSEPPDNNKDVHMNYWICISMRTRPAATASVFCQIHSASELVTHLQPSN